MIGRILPRWANKACAGRWGLTLRGARHLRAFFRVEFSLLLNRIHARPNASNAYREAGTILGFITNGVYNVLRKISFPSYFNKMQGVPMYAKLRPIF
jgi:hypothetical protein